RHVEEEAKQRAEEEAKRHAEEEAKQRAEEEAKRHAEKEAKQRAEEEAKRRVEKEAKHHAEDERKPKNKFEETKTDKASAGRKGKSRSRPEGRELEKEQRETKFGRKELHIAPGKPSKRKKFRPKKAAPMPKHGFEKP